jgi:hypothetical protein
VVLTASTLSKLRPNLHAREIEKRKQAESALSKSEEKFTKPFDAVPVAVSVVTAAEGLPTIVGARRTSKSIRRRVDISWCVLSGHIATLRKASRGVATFSTEQWLVAGLGMGACLGNHCI